MGNQLLELRDQLVVYQSLKFCYQIFNLSDSLLLDLRQRYPILESVEFLMELVGDRRQLTESHFLYDLVSHLHADGPGHGDGGRNSRPP